MSNKFENEIEEHKKQLEGIKKIYKEEKEVLQDKYNKCNSTNKKNLVELKKTKLENKKLQSELDDLDIIKEKETAELLKNKTIECEKFKQKIKSGISGGQSKFQTFLRTFENTISGGIIGQLRNDYEKKYKQELENYKNLKEESAKGVQKGGNPLLFMGLAGVKIALMTLGTFIFNWWPIMMFVSLYCVLIEYNMIKLSGQDIMGLPIVYLLGAYFCPCIWAIARLFMGWTTNANSNPKLFNVLSKCTSDGFNVNFHEYYGRDCKGNKCVWTTNECYNVLFGKENDMLGSMMGNISGEN